VSNVRTQNATYRCFVTSVPLIASTEHTEHSIIAFRSFLQTGSLSYKASGVDIAAGDSLVSRIRPVVALTNRDGVIGSIGGFGGLFDTKAAGYVDPVLVSGTDGVGTKLKVNCVCVCVCVCTRMCVCGVMCVGWTESALHLLHSMHSSTAQPTLTTAPSDQHLMLLLLSDTLSF
jgi:hypothetical protein